MFIFEKISARHLRMNNHRVSAVLLRKKGAVKNRSQRRENSRLCPVSAPTNPSLAWRHFAEAVHGASVKLAAINLSPPVLCKSFHSVTPNVESG